MQPRLVIAYSLLMMLVLMAVGTIAWMRYNSRTSKERRRHKAEDSEYHAMIRRKEKTPPA